MQQSFSRNTTIDTFRLIACIFIIMLHIDVASQSFDLLRLLGRWGVPFFFMISGYFYEKGLSKSAIETLKKSTRRTLLILIVVNVIYIPILILKKAPLFQWKYILVGDYFHIWFLHSLIIGNVVLYILHKIRLSISLLVGICVIILFTALIGNSYSFLSKFNPDHFNFYIRPFISIPFMLIGAITAKVGLNKNTFGKKTGIALFIGGLILQIIEAKLLLIYFNKPIQSHQFLIGTYLSSVGMFIIALTTNIENTTLGTWGVKYSLFIYLFVSSYNYLPFKWARFSRILY